MRGATPDGRADLYALGVVMFELLSGRRPHEASTMGDLLRQVASAPAPELQRLRPDLPRPLSALVARLLQREPQARPASGHEVAATLAELLAAATTHVSPATGNASGERA